MHRYNIRDAVTARFIRTANGHDPAYRMHEPVFPSPSASGEITTEREGQMETSYKKQNSKAFTTEVTEDTEKSEYLIPE